MPELPEVESIRIHLESVLLHKTVDKVVINEQTMFHGDPGLLKNTLVTDLSRKGKVVTIKLHNNTSTYYLSIHLKLAGQLLFAADHTSAHYPTPIPRADSHDMPAKTTRIIIFFKDGSALYFNDLRKFGWMKLATKAEEPTGIDVLSPGFTAQYLFSVLGKTKRAVKIVLMDQTLIAGIGNIYANDSLWQAKIHPSKPARQMNETQAKQLFECILFIINEGLTFHGSSAQDELYILPDGTKGSYQHHFKVYHRTGLPCLRCQTPIQRIELAGRGTFLCPTCQAI